MPKKVRQEDGAAVHEAAAAGRSSSSTSHPSLMTAAALALRYGRNGDGNSPAAANVVVPATGTVRFDFNLVQR